MDKLLSEAAPNGPRSVKTTDGGALLALSLHCAMPAKGCACCCSYCMCGMQIEFVPQVSTTFLSESVCEHAVGLMRKHWYTNKLAEDWNLRFMDEWVFEFARYAVSCDLADFLQAAL